MADKSGSTNTGAKVEQGTQGPVTNTKANLGYNDPAGDIKLNTGGGLAPEQTQDGKIIRLDLSREYVGVQGLDSCCS